MANRDGGDTAMLRLILALTVAATPIIVIAGGADGVWRTEANDDGA
jgi:hypothetical protein